MHPANHEPGDQLAADRQPVSRATRRHRNRPDDRRRPHHNLPRINEDAVSAAELNRIRQERLDAIQSGLHFLSASAMETLQQFLGQPGIPAELRLKTALAVLDRLGASQPEPIRPTDPLAVRRRYCAEMNL